MIVIGNTLIIRTNKRIRGEGTKVQTLIILSQSPLTLSFLNKYVF